MVVKVLTTANAFSVSHILSHWENRTKSVLERLQQVFKDLEGQPVPLGCQINKGV